MGKFGKNQSDIESLKAQEKSGELLKPGELVMYSVNWVYGCGYDSTKDGRIAYGMIMGPDPKFIPEAEDDDQKYLVHWLAPINKLLSYSWADLEPVSHYLANSKQ
tara:strand:- start:218 stop:532 length:315 start_codon:yes stop_codon:yes gene_type:complete